MIIFIKFLGILILGFNTLFFYNGVNKPTAKKENVQGIIVYEFTKNGEFYCEKSCYLITKKIKAPFFDIRSINVSILHRNKQLQHLIGSDTLYSDFVFEPDSTINLNFSSFKNNTFNKNGIGSIKSSEVYFKSSNNNLYIAFNFIGEVVHYFNVNYYKSIDSVEHGCCQKKMNIKDNFFVLSKVLKTNALNNKQQNLLKIKKTNINKIDIFYCE